MKKKTIIGISIVILIFIILIIYLIFFKHKDKCKSLKGDDLTYCKIIISGKENLVWEDPSEEKFRDKYWYMKDYFYQKLLGNKDKTLLYPLFFYNEILDKDRMWKYLDNCLNNETNVDILDWCISREVRFGTKEEVLKKIEKFKKFDNEQIKKSYKYVIDHYIREEKNKDFLEQTQNSK